MFVATGVCLQLLYGVLTIIHISSNMLALTLSMNNYEFHVGID